MKKERLIMTYNTKCGFEDFYIVEKDLQKDLTSELEFIYDAMCECEEELPKPFNVKDIYLEYEDHPQDILEEDGYFNGLEDIICDSTREDYAHTYFKSICYPVNGKPFFPGLFEIFNIRLSLEYLSDDELDVKGIDHLINIQVSENMKAKDVMALLNISRQTLSNYVKRGWIEAVKEANGQYSYKRDSVLELYNSKTTPSHIFTDKDIY